MELTKEREGKQALVKELKRLWYDLGGCEAITLDEIDKLKAEAARAGVYPNLEHYYLNREELMNYDLERGCKLVEFWHDKGVLNKKNHPIRRVTNFIFAGIDTTGLYLHFEAFMRTIELLGSEEQKAKWLPKCLTLEAIGWYCQTELGHGSDVSSLETTATYDVTSKEFIIHSPTVSSIKFWPGGLGKLSNHAVVQAQLYINGSIMDFKHLLSELEMKIIFHEREYMLEILDQSLDLTQLIMDSLSLLTIEFQEKIY